MFKNKPRSKEFWEDIAYSSIPMMRIIGWLIFVCYILLICFDSAFQYSHYQFSMISRIFLIVLTILLILFFLRKKYIQLWLHDAIIVFYFVYLSSMLSLNTARDNIFNLLYMMGLFAIQFIYMIILPTRPKPFFLSVIIANTIFLSVNLAYLPKNSFPDYQLITGFIIYTAIVLVTYLIIINYKYSEFIKKAELEDTYRVILRQKEELKNLNDNKNKFFSIIAHDLRNPIGTFHEAVNILSESIEQKDSIHINELISSMKHTSKNLFELLENLLDWSSLQNGSMPFSPAYEPVETIAELTLSMLDQQAKNKNIELKSEIPPNTNAFIDANMIIVVFRNIVSNAIKYTAKGGKVKITSRIVKGNNAFQFNPVKNSFEFVEVKVEDNGIGMHREHIANLFKIDKTTSYPGTNNEKGTGLGLVLCKEIIEKHGGQIRVESLLNEGSVFYFTLPTENFIRV